MKTIMKMWTSRSFARMILVAFLLVSTIPILILSVLFVTQSTDALTKQMENNLQLIAEAKAAEIDLRLKEVINMTEVAAHQAVELLETDFDPDMVSAGIDKYKPDSRNILGLDVFYELQGGADTLGDTLSNVYWNNEVPPSALVQEQIIRTEPLDSVFEPIKQTSPDTQWIYMTTTEGMMRLYPWASNDHYPDQWDPREIIFYTVADQDNNPALTTQWTPPYVDYAGAGWMVTVSTPMIDGNDEFLGVMSHDITINQLKDIALQITVLEGAGYGFLIDKEGDVIAHPDYQDSEATEGTQTEANLLTTGTSEFRNHIGKMIAGESDLGRFADESGDEQILVYAPIPSIGWSLGVVVPQTEVVEPATAMRSRAFAIAIVLGIAAAGLSYLLSIRLNRPISWLLGGVQQISDDKRPKEFSVPRFQFQEFQDLASAFNIMSSKVWERENSLKNTVAKLRIQIDKKRSQREFTALSETDYFKEIERNAESIRRKVRTGIVNESSPDGVA